MDVGRRVRRPNHPNCASILSCQVNNLMSDFTRLEGAASRTYPHDFIFSPGSVKSLGPTLECPCPIPYQPVRFIWDMFAGLLRSDSCWFHAEHRMISAVSAIRRWQLIKQNWEGQPRRSRRTHAGPNPLSGWFSK